MDQEQEKYNRSVESAEEVIAIFENNILSHPEVLSGTNKMRDRASKSLYETLFDLTVTDFDNLFASAKNKKEKDFYLELKDLLTQFRQKYVIENGEF